MEYYGIGTYLGTFSDLIERAKAIDLIIANYELKMLDAVSGPPALISYYELDDGQTRIKTNYRSIKEMQQSIDMLTKQKNKYINQATGRVFVLQDKRTFR